MRGGVKALLVTASLAVTGCTTSQGDFKIRPIADPASKKLRPGSDLLADARGQLALGNVGLAIEGFRKALREQPDNVEAYAGLAACYEQMGRYDVAQKEYESALAIAPRDPVLLNTFAVALDRWGNHAQAAEVRSEVIEIASASAVLDQASGEAAVVSSAPAAPMSAPVARPTTVVPVPASKPLQTPMKAAVAIPRPALGNAPVTVGRQAPVAMSSAKLASSPVRVEDEAPAAAMPRPVLASSPVTIEQQRPVAMARSEIVSAPVTVKDEAPVTIPRPVAVAAPVTVERQAPAAMMERPPVMASSITVKLPPARPAAAKPVVERQPVVATEAAVDISTGPRLERLSLGEVALITMAQPAWRTKYVSRTPQMATVRWVPLKSGPAVANVVLLNAARHQGLAADSRKYLYAMGWRKIGIGDAPQTRDRTVVMYPAGRERTARSLAAQFGYASLVKSEGTSLVVLLGRDVAAARG